MEVKFQDVNQEVLRTLWRPPLVFWVVAVLLSLGFLYGLFAWGYEVATGMGSTGLRPPVNWGIFLVNFVFWIGLAHSGTLISAILYLFRARFRTSINRMAEAMTMICILMASTYPLIHLGRSWIFYWLIPYPNQRQLWPDFVSPLIFDFLAVSTYFTVSLIFFYTGLVPDLAIIRDRTTGLWRKIYGVLRPRLDRVSQAVAPLRQLLPLTRGPRHGPRHLRPHRRLLGLRPAHTAGLAQHHLPALLRGRGNPLGSRHGPHPAHPHEAHLQGRADRHDPHPRAYRGDDAPHYIDSGLFLPGRALHGVVQREYFRAADIQLQDLRLLRLGILARHLLRGRLPLLFFFRPLRTAPAPLFIISILVNIGMWWERFFIVIQSISQNYLPFQWGFYWPNWVELAWTQATFCFLFLAFMVFAKFLPSIPISEVKKEAGMPRERGGTFRED